LTAGLVILVIHAQTCGLWSSGSGKFIPPVPPFFLLSNELLFILLFDTFKFVCCHSGDTVYIIIVGMGVAILVVRVLPQMGYCLAATSTDVLEIAFLLVQ